MAEKNGKTIKVGDKVEYYDEDDNMMYGGYIDWMILIDNGDVEISVADLPLGRLDFDDVKLV